MRRGPKIMLDGLKNAKSASLVKSRVGIRKKTATLIKKQIAKKKY